MKTKNPYLLCFQYLVPHLQAFARKTLWCDFFLFTISNFTASLLIYLDLSHPAKKAANSNELTNAKEITDLSSLVGRMLHFLPIKYQKLSYLLYSTK